MKNIGVPGVTYDPKDMSQLIYNGTNEQKTALSDDQRLIVDIIQGNQKDKEGNTVVLEADLKKDAMVNLGEGQYGVIPGESFMGNRVDEASKTSIGTQYFCMYMAEKMAANGIYNINQVVLHGLVESAIGAINHWGYKQSHNKAGEPHIGVKYDKLVNEILTEEDKSYRILKATYKPEYRADNGESVVLFKGEIKKDSK